jgi:hypothetical protein
MLTAECRGVHMFGRAEVPQIKECEMFDPDSSEALLHPVSIPKLTQGAALMSWLSDCQHLMFQL